MDNVVNLIVDILSMDSEKGGVTNKYEILATARELSVSDRHLAMMLDAGILKAFPLVGTSGFAEWMVKLYPEPIDGKQFEIIMWEVIASIGLSIALMSDSKHILKADEAAMAMLKTMAAWPNEPRFKQVVKDAKLAMFELNYSDAHTSIQRAKSTIIHSDAGANGNGGDSRKHIMMSYSQ